jgi:hypothetical protein
MALLLHLHGPPLPTNALMEGLVAQLIDLARALRNSHHQMGPDPEDPSTTRDQNCALFVITHINLLDRTLHAFTVSWARIGAWRRGR